jgi:hypothetical protein
MVAAVVVVVVDVTGLAGIRNRRKVLSVSTAMEQLASPLPSQPDLTASQITAINANQVQVLA